MALNPDSKVKLAAAIYGDFVTNKDAGNAGSAGPGANEKFGYKPKFPTAVGTTHEQFIGNLLSGVNTTIDSASTDAEITSVGEQIQVRNALQNIDLDIARAVYKRLREDFIKLKGAASSHDY